MKSFSYTPGYVYLIAGVLAFPATWLVFGRSGEDVPGMIAMVGGILFFGFFTFGLAYLRRSVLNRYSRKADSADDLR
jgi:drug/metabolite transporter (DMT)-like permease